MKYPTTRIVFDRKHVASDEKKGLVQLELLYERKRKFISTGVKVYRCHWDDRAMVHNCGDAVSLNKRILALKKEVDDWIFSLIEEGTSFDWGSLDSWLQRKSASDGRFDDFVAEMINVRDIKDSTRRTHRKLITALKAFKHIKYFSDLTHKNILLYDDFIRSRVNRQSTVYSYHKFLKTYINEAIKQGLVEKNPYIGFRVGRGSGEEGRYLTEEELEILRRAKMPTKSLERVRDLFVFQCLTGLSYSDLMTLDVSLMEAEGDFYVYRDKRIKTGITFTTVFVSEAMDILRKYDYSLPQMSNSQYNLRLKVVASAAGIDKPIASHWGRRTCGMYLLNKGFRTEIVSKILGHNSVKTTEKAYAKILDKSVIEAFRNVGEK